jgi:hypothetical protein
VASDLIGTGPFKLKNFDRPGDVSTVKNPTTGARACPTWTVSTSKPNEESSSLTGIGGDIGITHSSGERT